MSTYTTTEASSGSVQSETNGRWEPIEASSLIPVSDLKGLRAGSDFAWFRHELRRGEDIDTIRKKGLKSAFERAGSSKTSESALLAWHAKFDEDPRMIPFTPQYNSETSSYCPDLDRT
ncbi:uncharacterized protein I303_102691 [Kwoniella dejecticola CBS 10117]|uniref:Uncharacterized protein n=1 Tax=Kwoniella dejecticola CBS 10117 TaxID=1296121 RepID=A0A1A6A9F9_9TREE|nr:uncharacterized protein I303_02707 [Kwoniella dejecticola CBS 10117]OBR86695.1 hypothetical protein I303_02707 [Kwoniella dejecticola CBS 10117]